MLKRVSPIGYDKSVEKYYFQIYYLDGSKQRFRFLHEDEAKLEHDKYTKQLTDVPDGYKWKRTAPGEPAKLQLRRQKPRPSKKKPRSTALDKKRMQDAAADLEIDVPMPEELVSQPDEMEPVVTESTKQASTIPPLEPAENPHLNNADTHLRAGEWGLALSEMAQAVLFDASPATREKARIISQLAGNAAKHASISDDRKRLAELQKKLQMLMKSKGVR